jgi:hypothetical protein
MSPTAPQLRDQWALKGAMVRLRELDEEIKTIFELFPELRGSAGADRSVLAGVAGLTKKRRVMSPEARKRMSEGMRKFWQRRKAGAKSPKVKREKT